MKRTSLFLSFILLLLAPGCTVQRAQRATQATLNVMAQGVTTADAIIAERVPVAHEEAARQVEREMIEEGFGPGEAIRRWLILIYPYEQAIDALEVARESLYMGQGALDIWVSTGELPEIWDDFCVSIRDVFEHLVAMLEQAGVDVPDMSPAVEGARVICQVVASYLDEE